MIKKTVYKLYLLISALIIVAGGSILAWSMYYGASKLPLRQYFQRRYTNAVWDWSNTLARSEQDLEEMSDFMYLHQINAVYLDVGQYEKFIPDSMELAKPHDKQEFERSLERYIKVLGKRDIKVYAAAGHTDWSDPTQRHIPLGILRLVQEYNDKHSGARFDGMQFDIESYNQKGFSDGSMTVKSLVLTDFLEMVDILAKAKETYSQTHDETFGLGFAVPYWFDNENGNIPSITWRNKTGPTLYHLLDRLNRSPNNNIVVMSYRNAARGNDGVIAHSRTEVEYAHTVAPNVKVIIGQEVTDVEPAKITYYGQTATELSSEVKSINDTFQEVPQFKGIAINDLAGFVEMESNE